MLQKALRDFDHHNEISRCTEASGDLGG